MYTSTIWAVISCICVIVWSLLLWEAWNTPLMPDDYGFEDDDINIKKQQQLKKKK